MQLMRDNVKTNPELTLRLAREVQNRFPDSDQDEERRYLMIDALINLQKIGAARSEAEQYLESYPDGRYAAYIFAMTGASPRPKSPVR